MTAENTETPPHDSEVRQRRRALRQLEAWIETPMVALAFCWLGLVILELVWGATETLAIFGSAIWVIFVIEFALRFTLAPGKRAFLMRNWITILALAVSALRIFRAFRFLRVARAARGMRLVSIVGTANRGMNALRRSMGRRGLGYVLLLTILVVLLGGAGMFALERGSQGAEGLDSYGEAAWWTAMLIMTLSTDCWPQTVEGRILCVLLAVYGFAVFGYITASLASFFIGQEAQSARTELAGRRDIAALRSEVALLRSELQSWRPRPSSSQDK